MTAQTATAPVDYGFDDRLLPIAAVMELVGFKRTYIYRLIRESDFPKPCKPGGVSSRWSEREVKEWKDRQLAERPA